MYSILQRYFMSFTNQRSFEGIGKMQYDTDGDNTNEEWQFSHMQLHGNRAEMQPAEMDAHYICDSCGEEIVVPVDVTEGLHQDYVEDCPVCCNPMVIHVDIAEDGQLFIKSEHE